MYTCGDSNVTDDLFDNKVVKYNSYKNDVDLFLQIVYYHHAVLVHRLPPKGMKLPNLEQQTPNPPKTIFSYKDVKSSNTVFLQQQPNKIKKYSQT